MKQLPTDELDFLAIKENLKTFLRGQSVYDSYDFDGSAMSVLLDVLAFNTHYNLLYTNLAINESFIDSASKRSSVVSHAKSLGYTPNSIRSSKAKLEVIVTTPALEEPPILTMPRGTTFVSSVSDESFFFILQSDISTERTNGVYTFVVPVTEGTQLRKSFINADGSQFVIPNRDVDTSTLNVVVRESSLSTSSKKYNLADDILKIRGIEEVFFLKQRDDLYFEVYFGNDAIGKSLDNGNQVNIEYVVSRGPASNGCNLFTYSGGWRSDVNVEILALEAAFGGTEEESIESIRFNAPRAWISQNRAVTAEDYGVLLKNKYPNIESIHVWGGQDNIPKIYGKVFISAKPLGAEVFSTSEKSSMIDSLLKARGVVSVTPEFVDPLYCNIQLNVNVHYNKNIVSRTVGEIETSVRNVIANYGAGLNKFEGVFRHSRLSSEIYSADRSITSISFVPIIRSPITVVTGIGARYTRITGNPIEPGTVYSTRFLIPGSALRHYLKDNIGVMELYSEDSFGNASYISDVGKIDYSSGSWDIPKLNISSVWDPQFEVVFTPKSNDIISSRNIIVTIRPDLVKVVTIEDALAQGEGSGFLFSPVR